MGYIIGTCDIPATYVGAVRRFRSRNYKDDDLVYERTNSEHNERLKKTLERIKLAGTILKKNTNSMNTSDGVRPKKEYGWYWNYQTLTCVGTCYWNDSVLWTKPTQWSRCHPTNFGFTKKKKRNRMELVLTLDIKLLLTESLSLQFDPTKPIL